MIKLNTRGMDKVLNNFLTDIGFSAIKVRFDTDFAYEYDNDIICYTIIVSERMDRLFYNNMLKRGLGIDCGVFVASFLHEVGHVATLPTIDEEEMDYILDTKENINPDSDDDVELYFNLKDEYLATEWAINYINTHIEEIKKLISDFQNEMRKFCKKYEIEY